MQKNQFIQFFFHGIGFFLFCCSISIYANASYFTCLNSTSYLRLGDSFNQVIKTCGEPASQTVTQVPAPSSSLDTPIEIWVYNYIPNSPFTYGYYIEKPQALVVRFKNTYATDIFVEGQSVKETFYCRYDLKIKVGDSMRTIYQLCRWPTIKKTVTEESSSMIDQVELTYPAAGSSQPTKLYFQNWKLIQIGAN